MKPESLRVHRIKEHCSVLGPGTRAVLWFQGCSFSCPGCIANEMNSSSQYEVFSPQSLASKIASIVGIEGVTLSGGDPFDQPLEAMTEFLRLIRANTSLSVMCYTGRTMDQLIKLGRKNPPSEQQIDAMLSNIDLLVDGLYVEQLNDGSLWRGSSNQVIHFLTDRYVHLKSSINLKNARQLELELLPGQVLEITGIPAAGFLSSFRSQLQSRGVELSL